MGQAEAAHINRAAFLSAEGQTRRQGELLAGASDQMSRGRRLPLQCRDQRINGFQLPDSSAWQFTAVDCEPPDDEATTNIYLVGSILLIAAYAILCALMTMENGDARCEGTT